MGGLSVYFAKQVAIRNARLWCLQTCCFVSFGVFVIITLAWTRFSYVNRITPTSLIQPWVEPALVPEANTYWGGDGAALLMQAEADAGMYDYQPAAAGNWRFTSPLVAAPCGGNASTTFQACVGSPYVYMDTETIAARIVSESIFIPTAFVEDTYMPAISVSACPFPVDAPATECRSRKSYLIPGVEGSRIRFFHQYDVTAPESYFHRMTGQSREITGRLEVHVYDSAQDERFAVFDEEAIVDIPVSDLLARAGIDLNAALDGAAFPENELTTGSPRGTSRVTGLGLTLAMDYKNSILATKPICEITVQGEKVWAGTAQTYKLDNFGSTRTRTYSGIRVRFVRKGQFEWFQFSALVSSMTTFIVWMRIPTLLCFYFAVYGLGMLSHVYTRFLYQDLDLHREFSGVSARVLKRSHGFSDLQDLVESDGTRAISYSQAKKRLKRILIDRRELDEDECEFFAAFFFQEIASKLGASDKLAIRMEDYLKSVSSEESLQYEDLIMFVDTDNKKFGWREKLFIDGSLKKFVDKGTGDPEASDHLEPVPGPTSSTQSADIVASFAPGQSQSMYAHQSLTFQMRMAQSSLGTRLERLRKHFDHLCQRSEQLQERNENYLHYVAHLQEKVKLLQRK